MVVQVYSNTAVSSRGELRIARSYSISDANEHYEAQGGMLYASMVAAFPTASRPPCSRTSQEGPPARMTADGLGDEAYPGCFPAHLRFIFLFVYSRVRVPMFSNHRFAGCQAPTIVCVSLQFELYSDQIRFLEMYLISSVARQSIQRYCGRRSQRKRRIERN